MTNWATLARERADTLDEQVSELETLGIQHARAVALHERINTVRHEHLEPRHPMRQGIADHVTGDRIHETWNELHRIESYLDRLRPIEDVMAHARREVRNELPDARLAALVGELGQCRDDRDRHRVAVSFLEEAHAAAEARHEGERQRQRGILAIAAGLLFAAVLTLLLQGLAFPDEAFVPPPSEGASMSSTALLTMTMLFGALGGAFSALVSLYISDTSYTDTMWFDPRPALTAVKMSMGIWTAVVGVLAVGSGVLVGVYTTVASALLLAFLFGYGQQAVTTFMDKKVATLAQPPA
jgi:hypothetical protein